MQNHCKLSDEEFINKFENCLLNPADFTHEAHLRLAWLYIQDDGITKATEKLQDKLQAFVAYVGARNKYHTTLTIAAVMAVHHFVLRSKSTNFKDFIAEFPQLNTHFKPLIASHYSFDVFTSTKARNSFIAPDKTPFDYNH